MIRAILRALLRSDPTFAGARQVKEPARPSRWPFIIICIAAVVCWGVQILTS